MKPDLNEIRKNSGRWGVALAFRTTEAKERYGGRIVIRIISPDEWLKVLEIWDKGEDSAPKNVVKYLFREEAGIRRIALNERIEWGNDYEAVRKVASKWKDNLILKRRPAKIAYPSSWSRGIGADVELNTPSDELSKKQQPINSIVVNQLNPNRSETLDDASDSVRQEVKQTSPTFASNPMPPPHVIPKSQSPLLEQLKPTEKRQEQHLSKHKVVDAWVQILKRRLRF